MSGEGIFEPRDLQLAKEISNCPLIDLALHDSAHPCNKIVTLQSGDTSNSSDRQRPEPWMGNLGNSQVLFISSNPSINDEVIPFRENFPTFSWSLEEAGRFFTNRIGEHVTFNHSSLPNFITRSMDGQYRNGLKRPLVPQYTWKKIHDRAVELLGVTADPSQNYALTEIVHCKSRDEEGVKQSSTVCVDTWMGKILDLSPAKVLVIVGGQVRGTLSKAKLGLPETFGAGANYTRMTTQERSLRDIQLVQDGARNRLVLFNYHPAARQFPRKFHVIYGSEVTDWLQKIAIGTLEVPSTGELLKEEIKKLFVIH